MPPTDQIQELRDYGFTRVVIPPVGIDALDALRAEAVQFFTQNEDVKQRYSSDDFNFGYRPYGRQYSATPDRPDMNSSFTYWAGDSATIPGHDLPGVAGFVDALKRYWNTAGEVAQQILDILAEYYGYTEPFPFQSSSYLEVNWYLSGVERDLLQDRHEDGHLFTLAISDGPGLEIEYDGAMGTPICAPNELLVMAGGILEAMTDGQIPPLYHQVRNYGLDRRITVLMLVNPPIDKPTASYVSTAGGVDTASLARTNGAMFGLPPAPLLLRDRSSSPPSALGRAEPDVTRP